MLDKITINQHSSIRIDAGKILYIDPFKIEGEPHDADIIFFTHPHFDHFSPEDVARLAGEGTVFAAPGSMKEEALAAGIAAEKLTTFAPGEKGQVLGIPVEAVAAYNVGKPMHLKEYGWLGYVITAEGCRIYVVGDADSTPEGRAVDCDILLVPAGGTYTLSAAEAAEFANAVAPRTAIPTHYGCLVGSGEDAVTFQKLVDPSIEVCFKL